MRSSFNLEDLLNNSGFTPPTRESYAPARAQAPAPNNQADLAALLNQVAGGTEDVDFNKIINMYMPKEQVPQDSFSKILDVFSNAAAANRERPELGLGHAVHAGVGSIGGRERAQAEAMRKAYEDLHKLATEERKYKSEAIQDKPNPVSGEIETYKHGRYMGPTRGGGTLGMKPFGETEVGKKELFLNKLAIEKEEKKAEIEKQQEQNKLNKKFTNEATKASIKNQSKLEQLGRLENNLPKFYQGTGSELKHTLGKPFLGKETNKAFESFESDASALALEIAQNQKGAQSESDMQLIKKTKPMVSNSEAGNRSIIKALEAAYKREDEYAEAAKKWISDGKDPDDFIIAWVKYAKANPLLEEDENGELNINQERLTNWKDILFHENGERIMGAGADLNKNKGGEPLSDNKRKQLEAALEEKRNRYNALKKK